MNADEKTRAKGLLKIWNNGVVSDECLDLYVAYVDDLAFSDVKETILSLSKQCLTLTTPSELRRACLGMEKRASTILGHARSLGAHDKF